MAKISGFETKGGTMLAVASRYYTSRKGMRFVATNPTPGTGIASGQTSFSATDPTLAIYQAAQPTRVILAGLTLSLVGTVCSPEGHVLVIIDSANRNSAGGTAMTVKNPWGESSATPNATCKHGITASAAPGTERQVFYGAIDAQVGRIISLDFGDSISIGATGSILVYTWAGTTAPTWAIAAEWIEETI